MRKSIKFENLTYADTKSWHYLTFTFERGELTINIENITRGSISIRRMECGKVLLNSSMNMVNVCKSSNNVVKVC